MRSSCWSVGLIRGLRRGKFLIPFIMKLLTQALIKRFATVGRQEDVKDPIVIAKFFNPSGSATWYATEYNSEDQCFLGYVTGLFEDEWGYFSLDELEAVKAPPFGLSIERDLCWKEQPLSQATGK